MTVLQQAILASLSIYIPDNVNRIPTMTGATTSGVTASASQTSGDAWKTGDNNAASHWNSGSTGTHWLKYDFGAPQKIASYVVQATNTSLNDSPGQWTFEGSNDNSNWTTLDTQGPFSWTSNQIRTFNLAGALPKQYRYYRWNGLTGQTSAFNTRIGEVQLRS